MKSPFGFIVKDEDLGQGLHKVTNRKQDTHFFVEESSRHKIDPDAFYDEGDGWIENDAWIFLITAFPDAFEPDQRQNGLETLRNYYPNYYEKLTGTLILPTKLTSEMRYEARFRNKYKNTYIEQYAWRDSDPNVPNGYVLVQATLGGEYNPEHAEYFLIPEQEYDTKRTEFGFICNPAIHQRQELVQEN